MLLPEETPIPGQGAAYNNGPDFIVVQMELPDGVMVHNHGVGDHFVEDSGVLTNFVRS